MTDKKRERLTEAPLMRAILLFALPIVATSLLQLAFNTADTVMVGRFGGATPEESTAEMAAVGSCSSLITLFVNFFLAVSVGCGICVANDLSSGRDHDLRSVIHTSITLAAILGTVTAVAGALLARPILTLMGTDTALLPIATAYLRAYLIGLPPCVIYNFGAAILRARGDTVRPLIFLSLAGVFNVFFNFIAVVLLGMGAFGAGIATAISQWIGCALVIAYMMRTDDVCKLRLRSLGIERRSLSRVLGVGLPAGIQSALFNFSTVILQSAINTFGALTVAGNTAAANVESYLYTTQNSLYHTTTTFVAHNKAKAQWGRVRGVILRCSLIVALVGVSLGALAWAISPVILSLYTESAAAIHAGRIRLTTVGPFYFLCGLMEVGSGSLRGMGRSILPMLLSLFGCCALRILWVASVFPLASAALPPDDALLVLYLCFPISWFLTGIAQHAASALTLSRLKKSGNTVA